MKKSPIMQELPLGIVGGTNFGRFPKISLEETFNMIISDNFLVPYAGYKSVLNINPVGVGRAIFASIRFSKLVVVIEDQVWTIDGNFVKNFIGTINSNSGDVFIDENDNSQIAICDKENLYIYSYLLGVFQKITLDFTPAYITFQDGYFIAPVIDQPKWRLSAPNAGTSWPADPENIGAFQTKPDNIQACIRFPGKGGLLFVMGNTVTEPWIDTGSQLFPYQRSSAYNIDYGCLSAATIAASDTFIVFLGSNEKSGPVIMVSEGTSIKQISNEGFNFRFSQLEFPEQSYGFLFKQDGHLIYQLSFTNPADNLSLIYDFSTQKFFTVTDHNQNNHIARQVAFFNNSYYFVSFNDGNLYEFSTKYTDANGKEIPKFRICPHIRLDDNSFFIVNNITFTLEQGVDNDAQRIDFTFSINGGESFSNTLSQILHTPGNRQNRIDWWGLGRANDFIPQFRFISNGRFVIGEGQMSIYQ